MNYMYVLTFPNPYYPGRLYVSAKGKKPKNIMEVISCKRVTVPEQIFYLHVINPKQHVNTKPQATA